MPAKKQEKRDVERTTIIVLLVLTILLSVISTWYVLDMVNSVKQQYSYSSKNSVVYWQVSVGILPRPGEETNLPS